MKFPFPSGQQHTLVCGRRASSQTPTDTRANLQDGRILYNISHLHHISTYERSQI